jgi:hypothetical protein
MSDPQEIIKNARKEAALKLRLWADDFSEYSDIRGEVAVTADERRDLIELWREAASLLDPEPEGDRK